MYYPQNPSSVFIHILMACPILVIGLGLCGAVFLAYPLVTNSPSVEIVESSRAFQEKLAELNSQPELLERLAETERYFGAICRLEGPKVGLTKAALRYIERMIPDYPLDYKKILGSPERSAAYAKIYFQELVYEFKSVEVAVIAYKLGPVEVERLQKEGKELPLDYLKKVQLFL